MKVLIDSGASSNFINVDHFSGIKERGMSRPSVKLADGTLLPVFASVQKVLHLNHYSELLDFKVIKMQSRFDLILGQ